MRYSHTPYLALIRTVSFNMFSLFPAWSTSSINLKICHNLKNKPYTHSQLLPVLYVCVYIELYIELHVYDDVWHLKQPSWLERQCLPCASWLLEGANHLHPTWRTQSTQSSQGQGDEPQTHRHDSNSTIVTCSLHPSMTFWDTPIKALV